MSLLLLCAAVQSAVLLAYIITERKKVKQNATSQ
jgi:hypothetical protein